MLLTGARRLARPVNPLRVIRLKSRPMNGLSRSITWAIAAISVGQGIGILLGGPVRWSGPGYTVVRQLPASPYSWGIAILVCAGMALAGIASRTFWLKTVGLFGLSSWTFAFCVGSAWTTWAVPTAGTTGTFAYLLLSVVTALMIFVVDETESQDAHRRP